MLAPPPETYLFALSRTLPFNVELELSKIVLNKPFLDDSSLRLLR